MLPACPVCGFRFERGERGYWLGAYFLNLVIIETAFVIWFGGMILATWPNPPWNLIEVGVVVIVLGAPLACFPWSRTLFLAFDLWVRPATDDDYALPHEPAPHGRHG